MKKPFVALLLILAAAAMVASNAFAQVDELGGSELGNKLVNAQKQQSRASRTGASVTAPPDTVYVGKSGADHRVFTGPVITGNYWNIFTGDYSPSNPGLATNAYWGFDNSVGLPADTLNGWWPIHMAYGITSGTQADNIRPWMALDHGNIANYVLSAGPAAARTFGLIGMWHADPGVTNGVNWSPLGGTQSAWCGLRHHGDNTVVDQYTKNPFTQDVVANYNVGGGGSLGGGSQNGFPGYPDQIDQLLYRDIPMTVGNALTVSFKYRTRMSTLFGTTAATRTGWFHGDPLAVTASNFVSSTALGLSAPQDSFMVYVGAPVNDADVWHSDRTTTLPLVPVYDPQRRWFSEVLKVFGPGANYFEILGVAGNNPPLTTDPTPVSSATLSAGQVSTILGGVSGNVRLVFRCKTNRGFSDQDSRASLYSSGGLGAVQIDDVQVDQGAGLVAYGDFEGAEQSGPGSIDNRFNGAPGVSSVNNWRSTGKPPGENWHIEAIEGLTYNELCGAFDSPGRACNIGGLVATVGNHDNGERSGDARYVPLREVQDAFLSPTINLVPGPLGVANEQGISASIANATDDIILWYDIYTGMGNLSFTGNSWVFGSQSYPATQVDGTKVWGQFRLPGFQVFNPDPQCFTDWEPFGGNGQPFLTSNPSGFPDSLRVFLSHNQQCFRFGVLGTNCNSAAGYYFDNVTVAFVDLPGVPGLASAGSGLLSIGSVTSDIWQLTNDTFPSTGATIANLAAYDDQTAELRSGINIAATPGAGRFAIPGDTSVIVAANGTVTPLSPASDGFVRLDYTFRILPGPGNYKHTAGFTRFMTPGAGQPRMMSDPLFKENLLLKDPKNDQTTLVSAGDGSFWSSLISNPTGDLPRPGPLGGNNHNDGVIDTRNALPLAFAERWDPLTWNSVRMDTTETNVFPSLLVNFNGNSAGLNWQTTVHENDLATRPAGLGTNHFRCVLINPLAVASTTAGPGATNNVDCSATNGTRAGAGVGSGWDATDAITKEYSKIIPDGLLTPGSHVQYFYRKSAVSTSGAGFQPFVACPDTNFITPQNREGSTDQHRWQQFGVLPDRWKDLAFGGAGMACMLYIDGNDRRGNEGRFAGVMDSIGGTAAAKRGAHNGWTAPGTTNINGLDIRNDMSVAVSNQNSQPGTDWDMYGQKASESVTTSVGSIGGRLATQAFGVPEIVGRDGHQAPTPEMLRQLYSTVVLLTGDLSSGVMGPFFNRGTNEVLMLSDYLTAQEATSRPKPRGLFIQGDGALHSSCELGQTLLGNLMGVGCANPASYGFFNPNACADIVTTASLTSSADVYGVQNLCTWSNDLGIASVVLPGVVEAGHYEDVTGNPHNAFVSEIVHQAQALDAQKYVTAWSGYDIEHLYSRYCDTGGGRAAYYYHMIPKVFAGLCTLSGAPSITLDTPQGGRGYASFMKIGNSIMKQGLSLVRINQAKPGRVQVSIYDVAGRKIRNLADRVFPAGETPIQWDGTDDNGSKVGRGVYFVRTSVQKDSGRIIVLNN
jgi:hypothetical protein